MLGKLEIKECDFVSCKMACQFYINCTATISNMPFGVMILFNAEFAYWLNKVLCLSRWIETKWFLQIRKIRSLKNLLQSIFTVSHPSTPPRSIILVILFWFISLSSSEQRALNSLNPDYKLSISALVKSWLLISNGSWTSWGSKGTRSTDDDEDICLCDATMKTCFDLISLLVIKLELNILSPIILIIILLQLSI